VEDWSENLKGFARHVSPLEFAGIRRPLESTVEFVLKVSLPIGQGRTRKREREGQEGRKLHFGELKPKT